MIYGVKCPKCGLTQMPKPACKTCGAVLDAASAAPSRAPSENRAPRRVVTEAPAKAGRTEEWGIPEKNLCSECGLAFREDELIRFGGSLVCGRCKPMYVQRLREGVPPVREIVYAGFWIRVGARTIDAIILWLAGLALGVVIAFIPGQDPLHRVLQYLLGFVLAIAYTTYFVGGYSATPGKMACSLKVVRPDGEKISYGRACGRHFADMLSGLIFCIGYILVATDEEKRALHDRICDTRVVRA